jgi:hypothetical protein
MSPKKAKTKTAGVYRIDINGCYYFGSAVDLEGRNCQHLRLLKKGKHTNPYIQKFYNEGHKLKFKIVETCHREYVKFLEQTYLDAHHGKPKCLNMQPSAGVYLPVTMRREVIWNGVKYASRTEWSIATGHHRCQYVKFQRRGVFSDEDLRRTKVENRKNGRALAAEKMRKKRKDGLWAEYVCSPVVVKMDCAEYVFPNFSKARKTLDITQRTNSQTLDVLRKMGADVEIISTEEYYERQSKRAV